MTALEPPNDALGALMQRSRRALEQTQDQAARVIGISRRTWQRIERGEIRSMTPGNVLLIRGYLVRAGILDLELAINT